MKIEQRIGRLHRIGQTREVHVYSLCAQGSAEDRILDVLDRRIHLFELVIGEVDLILGRSMQEEEFEDRIFEIFARAESESEIAQGFDALAEELSRGRSDDAMHLLCESCAPRAEGRIACAACKEGVRESGVRAAVSSALGSASAEARG